MMMEKFLFAFRANNLSGIVIKRLRKKKLIFFAYDEIYDDFSETESCGCI